MKEPKVTKVAHGSYVVGAGDYTVAVDRFDHLIGPDKWIARAEWTSDTVTDPLPTKRRAVFCARIMIEEATSGRGQ
jgi:hypothetical protein